MLKRSLILIALAIMATPAMAQTSFYSDRALQQVNVLTSPTPLTAAIPYGSVRVCSLPLTQQSPCLPLATITDINGNAISNSIGPLFGQLTTDATGRFTFGCTNNVTYQVQVAASASNTPAVNYPVTCPGGVGASVSANNNFTGSNTLSNINHQRKLDGTTYPLTSAGFQQAVSDCITDSLCVDVDASQLGTVITSTTTSLTKKMALRLGKNTVIAGTSDPIICYSGGVLITGEGDDGSATGATIESQSGTSRVLAPCTANPRTIEFYMRGMDIFQTQVTGTAPVVDLTGVNVGRFDNNFLQSSGGARSLYFLTPASGGDCYYNVFTANQISAAGAGVGYDIENGCNSQTIYGGKIALTADCLLVTGAANQTNDINVFGTACEAFTATGIHTTQGVNAAINIKWFGGRFETASVANIFNISAGSQEIVVYSPMVSGGSLSLGTTSGVVSIYGYHLGTPLLANTTGLSEVKAIQANNFISTTGTSTFTNTAVSQDIAQFSGNASGNSNGVSIINTGASGHTYGLGELNNAGKFSIRDKTQTGQPFWSFQATSTAASVEALFTHAITASRVWTFPDSNGNVVVSPNSGPILSATSAAFATATTAGTCVQNTTAVTNATTAMAVDISPVSTPGVGAVWSAFVSSAGNVTINECAVAASAGGTIAFNLRVIP